MEHVVEMRSLGPFSVAPVGLGAMRLTGPNVFGPPPDRREALRVLREAVALGVNHIDTAQFYGPNIVNELIREALHPYPRELILVSKVGARRDTRGGILADDEPHQLRRAIEDNLRTLDVESLAVVNVRLMRNTEPDSFFDDQIGAMIAARDDGLIQSIGLSNVSRAHLTRALQMTDVACVQNFFHVASRESQPVLEECTRRGIAFVPFGSLGFGVTGPDAVLRRPEVLEQAARTGVTPAQLVLAWALALAPNMLLIPGASSVDHVRENLDAAAVQLDHQAVDRLSAM
ncbi:MAG TPA: aldo/keto reductase [Acidimicrobiia bacterium]|jgi:aryl-alcohol dehydrogenase-like predicted oxidoreductase|nr:aldo/keto reductase [Acidimicrobiia bacterium]